MNIAKFRDKKDHIIKQKLKPKVVKYILNNGSLATKVINKTFLEKNLSFDFNFDFDSNFDSNFNNNIIDNFKNIRFNSLQNINKTTKI